jgi:hypothetical protein
MPHSPAIGPAPSLVAALVLLVAPGVHAQEGALAPERLAALAAEGIPLVRDALGVELAGVEVRIGTRAEIEAAIVYESWPTLLRIVGDPARAEQQAAELAREFAPFLLAKYVFESDDVLIQPEAFERVAARAGMPELLEEPCVRAVLLHEFVHAADDERHDFSRLFQGCRSTDALRAATAVVEGHAQLVARDLAERFGCVEGLATYTRAITAPPRALVESGDTGSQLALRTQSMLAASSYVDGEAFFVALRAAGGEEVVQRAFREPPADTVVIARPEWFLDPGSRPHAAFDLEPALDAFADELDGDGWTEQRISVSAADLRALLAPLAPEEVDALAATLRQNRVHGSGTALGQQVSLALFEFGTAAEAAAYLEAYERMQRGRDEQMKEGVIRILSSDYETLGPPELDGVLVTKRIATPIHVDVTVLCATRGPLALELMAVGMPDWDRERVLEAARAALQEAVRHPRTAEAR